MAAVAIAPLTTEQQEKVLYAATIKQFQNRPKNGNKIDQYADLQSLDRWLYKKELENLHKEWEECNENDTNEKMRALIKKMRVTLREGEMYFQNTRGGQDQHDPIRWALHKLFKNTDVKDVAARFLIANIGGATLLVPMIIMSFATSRAAHLIVTCIFVLGFAFVFSISSRATNQELLGATAAYAAVLVVYVGVAATG